MRTKSTFTFLLAVALCLYGCSETEYIYVTSDGGSTTGTDGSSGLEDVDDVCTMMTDENFKEYCYRYFDTNYDWKVSMAEAELVTEIDCSTAEDFTGIEYFTNLESFKSKSVKFIDLSRNIQLSHIALSDYDVYYNDETGAPIESLDLSLNTNLTEIDDYAFYNCNRLSTVLLPENLTLIGKYAFAHCGNLTSISFPDGLTIIKEMAFYMCEGLSSVSLPEGITILEDYVFCFCTSLKHVSFPENLTAIGNHTFRNCKSLTSVLLPESLVSIGEWSFQYCINLESVVFPESLISIGAHAFSECYSLTSIALPKNLTKVEEWTFYANYNLISVEFPENLKEIGAVAFESCSELTSIDLPEGLISIGKSAFSFCLYLESVVFPESLISIEESAFFWCMGLTSIRLPENLETIGAEAFSYCTSLSYVSVEAITPPTIGDDVFSIINSSAILCVPSESIEAYANSDWSYYFDIILAIDDDFPTQDGDGTRENPYTVSQALEMLNSGTYDPDKGYYVKGIVSRWGTFILTWFEGLYTISYRISENGNYEEETSLFVDGGFDLGGEYFTSQHALSAGDKVIVYGRFGIDEINNDGCEIVHGKLYYWNGEFGELDDDEYFMERGDGSKENPYSVSQAVEMLNSGTYDHDRSYYVKGIVSWSLPNAAGIYYISEDGYNWPETSLYVNSTYGLGGELFSSEDVMSPLDQVIVYGKLSMDSGQPTMDGVKLYYWNGETADVE